MPVRRRTSQSRLKHINGTFIDSETGENVPVLAGPSILKEVNDYRDAAEQQKIWDDKKQSIGSSLVIKFAGIFAICGPYLLRKKKRKIGEEVDFESLRDEIAATEWTYEELLNLVCCATSFDLSICPPLLKEMVEKYTTEKYSRYWIEIKPIDDEIGAEQEFTLE